MTQNKEENVKWDIRTIRDTPTEESCTKRFEGILKKVGEEHKESLLALVTEYYLLGIEDYHRHERLCKYWESRAGPLVMDSLKGLYDKVSPGHRYVFD